MNNNEDGKVKRDIKTWEILRLLAQQYGEASRYACATEVSNGTGSYACRRLDFVAVCCWPSEGLKIKAFEVKISKSDFRHELTNASKHNIFFDEIDNYSIVAPNYVLDDIRIIPPKWGIYHVIRNAEGKLELKTVRKPLDLHDEQESKRVISRRFMASLARAIANGGASKLKNFEDKDELENRIRREIEEKLANGGKVISTYEYESLVKYRDACSKLGLHCGYGIGITDYEAKSFREARNVVDNIHHVINRLDTVVSEIRCAYKSAKGLLEGIDKNGGKSSEILKQVSDKLTPEDVAEKVSPEVAQNMALEQ